MPIIPNEDLRVSAQREYPELRGQEWTHARVSNEDLRLSAQHEYPELRRQEWTHARVSKPVINRDEGGDHPRHHIMCAWDDCEKQGYEMNKVVVNDAAPGYPPRLMRFVFCTDKHKQYFIHSHRQYGRLPPGYRMSTI